MIDSNEQQITATIDVESLSEEEIEQLKAEYAEYRARMDDAISELGHYLADTANQAVTDKKWLEDRAIDDYRQRLGLRTSIDEYQGRSKAAYNLTAIKCNAAKSRLCDILFPVSGKNYAIAPDAELHGDDLKAVEEGAQLLEDKIDDYLDACDYDTVGRKVISDCVDFGAGIVEGPIPSATVKKRWIPQGNVNALDVTIDTSSPVSEHVSWWDYFPDLSVADHKDCAYEFRRRYMAAVDLDMLKYRPDFNQHAIQKMLSRGGDAEEPYHLQQLRDESLPNFTSDSWCVFSGYIRVPGKYIKKIYESESERFEITTCSHGVDGFEDDHDLDVECIVWFSSTGDLLKLVPNPHALQKRCFHVVCYDRDTSCFLASRGLPRLMAIQQLQINNILRKIDDNSSLSSVPIIIYNPEVVEPVPTKPGRRKPTNEDYVMRGGMTWRLKVAGASVDQALRIITIKSNTGELLAVFKMVEQQADEVTMLPDILAGEQSATMTKTWHGIELLANNALIIQKRVEKDWSDNITVPMIDAYVDYILQFKPIPGVAGAFVVNVKGSAGLLIKESQAKNWMNAVEISKKVPEFNERTDWKALQEKIYGALQIDYEAITLSDEELRDRQRNDTPDIEQEKIKAMHEANVVRKYVADKGIEKELIRLQAEQIRGREELDDKQREREFNLLADERRIVLQAKAKEHDMAQQAKIELGSGRGVAII